MTKLNVYDMVTDRIIEKLEQGIVPWRAPWINYNATSSKECAVSHSTGKPYSVLNQMLLGEPGEYVTFKQAIALGGHVRKGAKGRTIVFWKKFVKTDKGDDGTESTTTIPMLKYYTVFHLSDCEGLAPKYEGEESGSMDNTPDEMAEGIVQSYLENSEIKLIMCGNRAFYSPSSDSITIPELDKFFSTSDYYATLFHEMVHSTGAKERLDRLDGSKRGSKSYSREELVAEIGAAALVRMCNLETPSTFDNSAAYVKGWLRKLKEDNKAIVVASGKAQKATDFILSFSEAEAEIEAEYEEARQKVSLKKAEAVVRTASVKLEEESVLNREVVA